MIDQLTLDTCPRYFYRASYDKPGPAAFKVQYNSRNRASARCESGTKSKDREAGTQSQSRVILTSILGLTSLLASTELEH